jgi:hypothetical protein
VMPCCLVNKRQCVGRICIFIYSIWYNSCMSIHTSVQLWMPIWTAPPEWFSWNCTKRHHITFFIIHTQ